MPAGGGREESVDPDVVGMGTYKDLVEAAAGLEMPEEAPPLKAMDDYRIVGTRRNTVDALEIVVEQKLIACRWKQL